jgi:hypothetical protein
MSDKKTEPRLDQITDTNPKVRSELLKKFASMTDAERLDILKLQMDLIRFHLANFKTGPNLSLGTLTEAIQKRVATDEILGRRSSEDDDPKAAQLLMTHRIAGMKKSKEGKKESQYRKKYHWIVKDLRAQGQGWRNCASYLKRFHRFQISHAHLKKLFEKYSDVG